MFREARNQIKLRRNFVDSPLLYVPPADRFTRQNLLVMERIRPYRQQADAALVLI